MSGLKEKALASIAEVEEWKAAGENWPQWNVRYIAFRQEATPAKVLELIAENERLERNRDMWKGQVELQAEELTSLRKDAEQWRALVGRAKDPVIGYTGCVICGSADHGGWSCQNHPGGKS